MKHESRQKRGWRADSPSAQAAGEVRTARSYNWTPLPLLLLQRRHLRPQRRGAPETCCRHRRCVAGRGRQRERWPNLLPPCWPDPPVRTPSEPARGRRTQEREERGLALAAPLLLLRVGVEAVGGGLGEPTAATL